MKQRLSRSEILFLAAYGLWLIFAVLSLTYFKDFIPLSDIRKAVEKIVVLLLACKLLEDNELDTGTLLGLAVMGLAWVICQKADITDLYLYAWFIFSMRNLDYRRVFRFTILLQLVLMGLTVGCTLMGLLPNELWRASMVQELAGDVSQSSEYRDRYSWGYTYCTYGSHIALFLTLTYMSLKKTLKLWQALMLLAFNLLWLKGTNTYTDLFLFLFSIIGLYVVSRLQLGFSSRKIARILYALAGPAMAVISIGAQYLYDGREPLWRRANSFFNGRLKLGNEGIREYGIPLLGQKLKWVGARGAKLHPDWVYNYVDSSYLKYAIHYGILFEIVLLVGLFALGWKVAEEKNPGLQMAFLTWVIYGMIDAELLVLAMQPIMLLLGLVLAGGGAKRGTVPGSYSLSGAKASA